MRRFFRWVANQIFPHWHYRYPLFHRVLDVWFVILLCPIFVVVQSFIVLRHLTESLFLVWFQCKPGPYELQQLEAKLELAPAYDELFGELRSLISYRPMRKRRLAEVMHRLAHHYPERSKVELGCYVAPVMQELTGRPLCLVRSPEEFEHLDEVFPGLSVEALIRGRTKAWAELPQHLGERVLVVTVPDNDTRNLDEAVARIFPAAKICRFSPSSPRINLLPISYDC